MSQHFTKRVTQLVDRPDGVAIEDGVLPYVGADVKRVPDGFLNRLALARDFRSAFIPGDEHAAIDDVRLKVPVELLQDLLVILLHLALQPSTRMITIFLSL